MDDKHEDQHNDQQITAEQAEQSQHPRIESYTQPAAGWGALLSVARNLAQQGIVKKGSITLLNINQPTGFDCPGCAWPEQKHTHTFNFCENGAKAIAFEATSKRVPPEFFAEHSVSWLSEQSDYFLEMQGRLTDPLRYDAATDHYVPISWDEAFGIAARHLKGLANPNQAAFYTSGRTSNEAAFLYQLFVRNFGTNNFPDCSNMCHETTSYALGQAIGLGKGTVTLDDFEVADAVFLFGQNPGTNHPRMLSTLREMSKRGAKIVAINPLKERGLERFQDPQSPIEMMTNGSTRISSNYFQPKVGGDYAVLMGMMKHLIEWDRQALDAGKSSLFDHAFIEMNTVGFAEMIAEVDQTSWATIHEHTGLSHDDLRSLSKIFCDAKRAIFCWGMGITQNRNGVANIHMLTNLMLARGHIGRAGGGLCPVRGHSNVQGDRTMGIYERPVPKVWDRLDQVFGIKSPRTPGLGVIETISAMAKGEVKVFFGMGGNFAVAAPDTPFTQEALRRCELTAHVATKLNRSHLICGKDALILPCLGRTEIDMQVHGSQSVSVEDSMSNVHLSAGKNEPASDNLLSEPAIVARLAEAVLPDSPVKWSWYIESYDRIRDAISEVFDEFHDFNARVYHPGGFHLPHPANQHEWHTKSGKAEFHIKPIHEVYLDQIYAFAAQIKDRPVYTLMSMRSHDQYNTTIYGLDDRYRGVFGQRRVLFMNQDDIREAGLAADQWVDIESIYPDQVKRIVRSFRIVPYNIPRGSLAAYYPEANPLVALSSCDDRAKIPASKSIPVILHHGFAPEQMDMPIAADTQPEVVHA